ncbi:MAG: AsmA family protein, partial [Candidatus Zixiibacteriota bacterium]
MKKFAKILLWVAGVFVVLLLLLVLAVKLFLPVETIKAMAVEKGTAALGRPIAVGGLDISIWGGFGVELQQVQMGNPAGFDSTAFLTAEKIDLKMQLLPLLSGDIRFDRLVIERPVVRMLKVESGDMNYTFAPADTTAIPEEAKAIPPEGQAAALAISFEALEIKDGAVSFRDDSTATMIDITGLDLTSSLAYPREGMYEGWGRLVANTIKVQREKPLPMLALEMNYRAAYDLSERTLTVENITASINQLPVKLSGIVTGLPDIATASLNVSSDQIALADALSLLSAEQRAKLADYTLSGDFAVDVDLSYDSAEAKAGWLYTGSMALSDVRMRGRKFPGELAFKRCLVDFDPNKLRLNIEEGSFDKQPLKGYLTVEDFANPRIAGELAGSMDLAIAAPFLPAGQSHDLAGRSKFDLKFSGPVRDVEALAFSGDLTVSSGKYNSKLVPEPIESFELDAFLDQRVVNIRRLEC